MERLTNADHKEMGLYAYCGEKNPYEIPLTIGELACFPVAKYSQREILEEVFARLAAYEDTGLEPEEIMALIEENGCLHKENFWLTSGREPGPQWISMEDKLPPENGSYIVCTKMGAVCTATFNVKLGRWGHSLYGITHWMPLPKAPGEGK